MKKRDKKHILVGIPTADSNVSAHVANFSVLCMKQNQLKGCPFRFSVSYLIGTKPTELARNTLVTQALDGKKVDAIWFVDSDMVPSPNSLDLLNDYDKADILAGIAPIFTDGQLNRPSFSYNYYRRHPQPQPNHRDFAPAGLNGHRGPLMVDGAGTACMIIKSHVLRDKRLWLHPDRFDGIVPLFRWPRSVSGATLGTDDLDFCRRASQFGYTMLANTSVRWGHLKEVDLAWIIDKINSVTASSPERLATVNEWNEIAAHYAAPTVPIIQFDPSALSPSPPPSGEAAPQSSDEALIAPPVAN